MAAPSGTDGREIKRAWQYDWPELKTVLVGIDLAARRQVFQDLFADIVLSPTVPPIPPEHAQRIWAEYNQRNPRTGIPEPTMPCDLFPRDLEIPERYIKLVFSHRHEVPREVLDRVRKLDGYLFMERQELGNLKRAMLESLQSPAVFDRKLEEFREELRSATESADDDVAHDAMTLMGAINDVIERRRAARPHPRP